MVDFSGEITKLSEIYSLPYGHSTCMYRGHSNASWVLIPSIFRSLPRFKRDEPEAFELLEQRFVSLFFDLCRPYLNPAYSGRNFWDRIIAQHHGLPTRLLDVTSDPHVALYFSVICDENMDGSVVSIRAMHGVSGMYDPLIAPNAQDPSLVLGDREVILVESPILDQRITAQKSKFLLSKIKLRDGSFIPLEERDNLQSQIEIYKVPRAAKKLLKKQLNLIGVNKSGLFPGMSGVASVLRDEMLEIS